MVPSLSHNIKHSARIPPQKAVARVVVAIPVHICLGLGLEEFGAEVIVAFVLAGFH